MTLRASNSLQRGVGAPKQDVIAEARGLLVILGKQTTSEREGSVWWAGTGLNRRHQGIFRPAPISRLGRMTCWYPLQSVVFEGIDLAFASGSRRIATPDSVRVEFESTRAVDSAEEASGDTGSNPHGEGRPMLRPPVALEPRGGDFLVWGGENPPTSPQPRAPR
jgi:hypothetical protein